MTQAEIATHPLFPTLVLTCRHANEEQSELVAAHLFGRTADAAEARAATRNAEGAAALIADRIANGNRHERMRILTLAYASPT